MKIASRLGKSLRAIQQPLTSGDFVNKLLHLSFIMRLISATTILLAIGSSIGCQVQEQKVNASAHSFYLSYEVDFGYFKDNLSEITPTEFNCYFDIANNSTEPAKMNFSLTGNDVFFARDSTFVPLRSLVDTILIQPSSVKTVPNEFPYRQSKTLKSLLKGTSMADIAERIGDIDFS